MTIPSIVSRAYAYAERAHAGQTRKYTGLPYFTHCVAVMEIVRTVPHTPQMLAAALLHDSIEDTPVTADDLFRDFGLDVARYVVDLTSPPLSAGNRAARHQMDIARLSAADPRSKTIKLADIIDNTATIVERDPAFARVYLKEKAEILEVLKSGDSTLYALATSRI